MSLRGLFFSIVLIAEVCFAQSDLDSVFSGNADSIVIRKPDNALLQTLRADKQLQYAIKTERKSAWDRFWDWLGEKLISAVPDSFWRNFYDNIGYIIVAVAIVVVGIVFKRMRFSGNVYAEGKDFNPDSINVREISQIKLDEQLSKALANQDYNRAVLIAYLLLLKKLDSSGVIRWQKSKTNAQFAREIANRELKLEFLSITRIFDTIKYGYVSFSEEELLATVNRTKQLIEMEIGENEVII